MSDVGALMIMVGLLCCAWGLCTIANEIEDASEALCEALTAPEVTGEQVAPVSIDFGRLSDTHQPD